MLRSVEDSLPTLDIGPGLSSRQKKAAAAIGLGQLLALADLRATACRAAAAPQIPRSPNDSKKRQQLTVPSGLTAVYQLRQGTAKRRAENDADAAAGPFPKPLASGPHAAAVKGIGRKRVAIQAPLGTMAPANPSSLGCQFARRCADDSRPSGRGRVGQDSGGGSGGSSSLARVYVSRVRLSLLPEDYAECFVDLEPQPQPDPDDLVGPAGTLPHPGMAAGGPPAVEAALAAGGGMMGAAGVAGDPMSFLFTSPSGLLQQSQFQPPEPRLLEPGLPGSGLLVDPGAAAAAAAAACGGLGAFLPQGQEPILANLPYGAVPVYGALPGAEGRGMAAAPGSAPELMLDADEDESDSDVGDGDMGMGQGDGGYSRPVAPGIVDGMDGLGAAYGFVGGIGGMPLGPVDPAAVGVGGAPVAASVMQDDDGALVEEF